MSISCDFKWTGWRSFKLVNRVKECVGIYSFYFEPIDGCPTPLYRAGQVIALRAPGYEAKSFVLSGSPNENFVRLTIRCFNHDNSPTGEMTRFLVRELELGQEMEMSAPTGDFVLDHTKDTPVVFVCEGVGLVPALGFASEISTDMPLRPLHILYSARNSDYFPHREEIKKTIDLLPKGGLGVFFREPRSDDKIGQMYDVLGDIDVSKIRSVCLDPRADYYLAGGRKFIADIKEGLQAVRVTPSRIHSMIMSQEN